MADHIYRLPPVVSEPGRFGALSAAPKAWSIAACEVDKLRARGSGRGIRVAVLDTGCDAKHPELKDRIVDMRSFVGFDPGVDPQEHGSHVAGTVGAKNREIGVANEVEFVIGQVLSPVNGSGSTSGIADGIEWATSTGAHIISASFGGGGRDARMSAAIARFVARGGIFLAAAGNSRPSLVDFPGNDPSALAVAACDQNFNIAGFSSVGQTNATIALTAPGVDILSTVPDGYGIKSGTSMATPFGAGTTALVLSIFLDLKKPLPNSAQMRNIYANWCWDRGFPGADRDFGPGCLNCGDLVRFFDTPNLAV